MTIFEELKRRNVVRMALLYVIASWVILQIADVLFDALDLPSTWVRLVLGILLLGFPLALLLSWVYEITPEGLKRESEIDRSQSANGQTGRKINILIAILLVLAIASIGADRLIPETTTVAVTEEGAAVIAKGEGNASDTRDNSVAVLPFANRSSQEDDVYFVDGIHDDILTQLAGIESLIVTSRTSVEQFRNTSKSIPEIGAILGVGNILEGGVQRSGNRVRINLQLISVSNDDHLWAETFESELTASNIFDVQHDVAKAVTEALRATLHPEEVQALRERPTESIEAYDLYLLGRHHWNRRTEESIQLARGYFEKAIEKDPEYVLALSGLADSYTLLVDYGNLSGEVAYPMAQGAIDKAMQLDDSVSEVWASLGLLRSNQVKLGEAEQALLRSIELDRRNFSAWSWYGNAIDKMRRHEEALVAYQEAYALEPMSKPINSSLAWRYANRGDFALARQHFERSAQLDPERSALYKAAIADTYNDAGDQTAAITLYRSILGDDPRNVSALQGTGDAYLALGDTLEASAWFARVETISPVFASRYWLFEAEHDYAGAVIYLEDKLRLIKSRSILDVIRLLFRASYLAGDMPAAKNYLSEFLQALNGRLEIEPSSTVQLDELLIATYLIRHGEANGFDGSHGREMVNEIHAGLESLKEQGYVHPLTLASLAIANALQDDSLGAFEHLDEAIDQGYRNQQFALEQPAFDGLRNTPEFRAIDARVREETDNEDSRLAGLTLPPYTAPGKRQPIALSRTEFGKYEGYYSDGNALIHVLVADDGSFIARMGQAIELPILAFGEDVFYTPLDASTTMRFVADEGGTVTHMLLEGSGGARRFKATEPPPPTVELGRDILERYEGSFAWERPIGASEDRIESDTWVALVSIDPDGSLWFDLDDQPRLRILPVSETEFYLLGFDSRLEFILDRPEGQAKQIKFKADGRVLDFYRL